MFYKHILKNIYDKICYNMNNCKLFFCCKLIKFSIKIYQKKYLTVLRSGWSFVMIYRCIYSTYINNKLPYIRTSIRLFLFFFPKIFITQHARSVLYINIIIILYRQCRIIRPAACVYKTSRNIITRTSSSCRFY